MTGIKSILGLGLIVFMTCADAKANTSQAEAEIGPTEGNTAASGNLTFTQTGTKLMIAGEIRGLSPGEHGFHIHEHGDCGGMDAKNAGSHFNPSSQQHGTLNGANSHAGDLGNIKANKSGIAEISIESSNLSLSGSSSVVGRSVIVHEKHDDTVTQPTGASGSKIACGIIK